ncbi:MAG: double-CXXCG motif protein [Verrucomicrobiota bacterium]
MSHAFEIRPDQPRWGKLNSIEASHFRKLPGVRCPNCGAWALTGLIYPAIEPSVLNDMVLTADPSPLPVEQFYTLAASIQPVLGENRPAKPGTELGPLRGKAKGNFGDFAWVNPWTPLLRESVWLALRETGIHLAGVRAELDFGRLAHESLIELETLPTAALPSALLPEKCSICGRLPVKRPDTLCVDASSFDASIPLQRIAEIPTVLVANELFAQFIEHRNLRDVIVTPVKVNGNQ